MDKFYGEVAAQGEGGRGGGYVSMRAGRETDHTAAATRGLATACSRGPRSRVVCVGGAAHTRPSLLVVPRGLCVLMARAPIVWSSGPRARVSLLAVAARPGWFRRCAGRVEPFPIVVTSVSTRSRSSQRCTTW